MQASIVDLRYKMKSILSALRRHEVVSVLYHNKKIASLVPIEHEVQGAVREHPFFGMFSGDDVPVSQVMDRLRASRHDDI